MMQLITPATISPRCIGRDIAFSNSVWTAASVSGDMEVDEFNILRPVHLLNRAASQRIQGCVQLLPSTDPTMLKDTFPILLDGSPTPRNAQIWESSRFALDMSSDAPKTHGGLAVAAYELFAGMIEFGLFHLN